MGLVKMRGRDCKSEKQVRVRFREKVEKMVVKLTNMCIRESTRTRIWGRFSMEVVTITTVIS